MAEHLINAERPVAELRKEISELGLKPKGRSRADLARQLAEAFADADRLASSIARLSQAIRHQLTQALLHFYLNNNYAYPSAAGLWQDAPPDPTTEMRNFRAARLAVATGGDRVYVPYSIRKRLPPLQTDLPSVGEPSTYQPAQAPHRLLTQIQQLLGLLQSKTLSLRPRLQWLAPRYPYADQPLCWPPCLEDAQHLLDNVEQQRMVCLQPPHASLDDDTQELVSETLGMTLEEAEFVYRLLVAGGIIWEGSPLAVDADLVQRWLELSPGEQRRAAYQMYTGTTGWAAWWPAWRSGDVAVRHIYHGYWGLMSLNDAVHSSVPGLRRVVLEVLAFLPHDTWLAFDDVSTWLQQLFPAAETQGYLMSLVPEHVNRGWRGFLDIVLLQMLIGPLWGLGLVDVSPSADDVRSFRLHYLQDLHWGRVAEVPVPGTRGLSPEAISFVPDADALEITTPVPPDLAAFLLRWTRPAGLSQSRVRYALEAEKLHSVFERGDDPTTLCDNWLNTAGFPVVPEVLAWWTYWWQRYGRVRLYAPHALLQTRDAATMQELALALPDLTEAIAARVTSEAVLIDSKAVDDLVDALLRQGYMPKEIL